MQELSGVGVGCDAVEGVEEGAVYVFVVDGIRGCRDGEDTCFEAGDIEELGEGEGGGTATGLTELAVDDDVGLGIGGNGVGDEVGVFVGEDFDAWGRGIAVVAFNANNGMPVLFEGCGSFVGVVEGDDEGIGFGVEVAGLDAGEDADGVGHDCSR